MVAWHILFHLAFSPPITLSNFAGKLQYFLLISSDANAFVYENTVPRVHWSTCYSPDASIVISSSEARHVGTQTMTTDVHILILQVRVPTQEIQELA